MVTNISYISKGEQRVSNNISYDEMGNIISSVQEGASSLWSSTKKYSYDKVNQLISYKENGDITNYSYDGSGNMVKKSSSFEPDILYNYNALNQLTEKTVGTTQYNYSYDNRGNLKSEKVNGVVSKMYVFDGTDHLVEGNNVETGEQSKYTYNALDVRVRLEQRIQNTNSSYSNSENFNTSITPSTFTSPLSPKEEIKLSVPTIKGAITQSNPFVERDISYVVDYVSDNNNEIMLLEKDSYSTAIVYGRNSERLVQKTTLPPSNNKDLDIQKPNIDIVSEELGKVYFQSDILGHAIFASDDSGNVMSYMEYDPWGKIVTPYLGDMNTSGLDSMNRFTNHTYDSVIDKYFAQARFYDAENSRMISIDPEYSDSNLYSYVFNNPVNYTDPDGKIPVFVIPIVKFIASISLKKVAKGASFGALKGVIAEVAGKLLNEGDELNFKDILISAFTGALSGTASDIIKQKTKEESKVIKETIIYTSKFILNVIKSLGTKLLEGKPITIDETISTLKKSLRKTAIDFVFQKAKKKNAIKIGKITMDRDLPWILNTVIDLFGEEFKNNILDLMGSKINSKNSKSPVKAEYNRKPNPPKLMPRDRSLKEAIEPIEGSPTNTSNTLQDKYNNHLNETKNDRGTPLANEYYMICTPKAKKKAEGQSPKSPDNKTNKQNEKAIGYQTQWYLNSDNRDPRKNSKATNIKNPLSMPVKETNMIKYYALHRTTQNYTELQDRGFTSMLQRVHM